MLVKRPSNTGSNDLHVVYRPCRIEEIVGNDTNKRILKKGLEDGTLPHSLLFTGPAGCGKTTAARIVALGLNCKSVERPTARPCLKCESCLGILNQYSMDVAEINVGREGGKADVDAVVRDLPSAPFDSRYKVIIFDEAHKLTEAAKDLLLKPVEDGYKHVYYIFCTNQPEKLKAKRQSKSGDTFLDRVTVLNFKPVSHLQMVEMLTNVCEFEGVFFDVEVLKIISQEADGVPRKALVWLNQITHEASWTTDAAYEIIGALNEEEDAEVLELCRTLNNGEFKSSCELYEKLKHKGAESIRISIAGYFVSCLRRSKTIDEAFKFEGILDHVLEPIFESGKLGDMKLYHIMFKVTKVVRASKGTRGIKR